MGELGRVPSISRLKAAGIFLLAAATSLAEARILHDAGIDAIVAQGFEAGGHRGIFDTRTQDDCLGTIASRQPGIARQCGRRAGWSSS